MSCDCDDRGPGVRPGSLHGLACSKPEPKVKLETVILQAQLGSDEEGQPYAPKFGKYTNTVVKYLANDAVYIYDGVGQFTLFSKHGEVVEGEDGYINGDQLFQIKTALEEMDEQLQQQIADETVARETKDQELEEYIEQEETARIEAVEQLTNDLDEETKAREDGDNELQSQLDALAASTDVIDVVDTYADLQGYDTANVHLNDIIKVLNDETHDGAITYYRWNGSQWNYVGSTGPYYTKAEADDRFGLKEDVENALGEIAEITADYVKKDNVKTINGESILGEGDIEIKGGGSDVYDENGVNITDTTGDKIKIGRGATAQLDDAIGIGFGAASKSIMTTALGYNANATAPYSMAIGGTAWATHQSSVALGSGSTTGRTYEVSVGSTTDPRYVANVKAGEKDTDAVNKKQMEDYVAEHGGGGGKLYSEYGDNEDGALTQKFVSEKLNGNSVAIGLGTQTTSANAVAIGANAKNLNFNSGTAIGANAQTTTQDVVAIGNSAIGSRSNSIALGTGATTSRSYELSIGIDGSTTRYIANVRDGEKDTDAVTVKQLNTAVGDITAVLARLSDGAGV